MLNNGGLATYTWTSYNLPNYFNNGSLGNSQFYYNANHQRFKHRVTDSPGSWIRNLPFRNFLQQLPVRYPHRHLQDVELESSCPLHQDPVQTQDRRTLIDRECEEVSVVHIDIQFPAQLSG